MSNEIYCPNCSEAYVYEDAPPKFCSECGSALGSTISPEKSATIVGIDHGTVVPLDDDDSLLKSGTVRGGDATQELDATHDFNSATPRTPLRMSGVPKQVGSYRILNLLGRGGMGAVYRAEELSSGRHVALKILSGNNRQTSEAIERFKREGQIAASISHSRSTFVYAAGKENEVLYIVMELMSGGTIKDEVVKNGPMSVNRAVDCILDVIDGLEVAHQVGIIHRDIKPSNCFLEDDGRVKIGDYGLSKSFVGNAELTRTGSFMGTPQFAATEQVKGGKVDERTDIYALGCTLFYLLTGRPPFEGDFAKVIAAIAAEPVPDARSLKPDIPKTLARLISQTMQKDAGKRPQTLNELRNSLEPFATRGGSFADIGRRVAAFCLDWFYVVAMGGLFTLPAIMLVFVLMNQNPAWQNDYSQSAQIIGPALIVQGLIAVLYFSIAEGFWGCGLGKLIMGLRVTNLKGESPGFFRSLLRASLLPGLTLLVVGTLPRLFDWQASMERIANSATVDGHTAGTMGGIEIAIQALVMNYVTWIFSALFFVTMRRSNGFRGVHGFLSGTKVQSKSLRKRLERSTIPIVMPRAMETESSVGKYQTLGQLCYSSDEEVSVAVDPELDRNVWISRSAKVRDEQHSATADNRPSRQRWLDGGRDETGVWNAWEAVRGLPLMKLLDSGKHDWPQVCSILIEVAEELADGTKEDSIPRPFGVDHIWIDESSQIKFVQPKVSVGQTNNSETNCSPTQALRQLIQQVARTTVVPLHFLEFGKKLDRKQDGAKTLVWAVQELTSIQSKARKWRWDDRLGVIAISSGLEQTLYQSVAFVLAFLFASLFIANLGINVLLMMTILMAFAFAVGFWSGGGLVFKFLNIIVCNSWNHEPASRIRCGLRNLVAWSPFLFSYALLSAWISFTVGRVNRQIKLSQFEEVLSIIVSATWSYPLLLFYLGALVAIIIPQRGLQDFICRTRLYLK